MELEISHQNEIISYAKDSYPNECCGIIVDIDNKMTVVPCPNRSTTPEKSFAIYSQDIQRYNMDLISGFYHSHKDNDSFTIADIAFSEKLKKDSFVYVCDKKIFKHYTPYGARIPYVGRQFFPGVLDCVTLTQDYFQHELNIKLSNCDHPYRDVAAYWHSSDFIEEQRKNSSLLSFLSLNGFVPVDKLTKFDVIVFSLLHIPYPAHIAVYLGEHKILHHLRELSAIEPYRDAYKRLTLGIYRHKELL